MQFVVAVARLSGLLALIACQLDLEHAEHGETALTILESYQSRVKINLPYRRKLICRLCAPPKTIADLRSQRADGQQRGGADDHQRCDCLLDHS